MKVEVERSGGFAGMSQRCVFESDELSPDERQQLLAQVEAVRFFQCPAVVAPDQGRADSFQWVITIEREGQTHTVQVQGGDLPPDWQALIEQLQSLMRRFRRRL